MKAKNELCKVSSSIWTIFKCVNSCTSLIQLSNCTNVYFNHMKWDGMWACHTLGGWGGFAHMSTMRHAHCHRGMIGQCCLEGVLTINHLEWDVSLPCIRWLGGCCTHVNTEAYMVPQRQDLPTSLRSCAYQKWPWIWYNLAMHYAVMVAFHTCTLPHKHDLSMSLRRHADQKWHLMGWKTCLTSNVFITMHGVLCLHHYVAITLLKL